VGQCDKKLVTVLTYGKMCQIVQGRGFQADTAAHVKTGMMPGANERVLLQKTIVERRTIVRAVAAKGVVLSPNTCYHDGLAFKLKACHAAVLQQ
jgi:hypothetical protein